MKLISLNVWCGIKYDTLAEFLRHQAPDTDIFCFQEVRNGKYSEPGKENEEKTEMFKEISNILINFSGHFSAMVPGVGIASFISNKIVVDKIKTEEILSTQDVSKLKMADGSSYYPRIMQSIYLTAHNLVIHNFHGVPGSSKKDTSERNIQTERLLQKISAIKQTQVIVGDFNLDINTEAIKKLGENMNDLIKKSDYKTTRNYNYQKIKELPFADYAFVSPELKIKKFEVLLDEVSDHLPLLLEW